MMRRRFIVIVLAFGAVSALLVIPAVLNTDKGVWGPVVGVMAAMWLAILIGSARVGARIDRERAAFAAAAATDLGPEAPTAPPA